MYSVALSEEPLASPAPRESTPGVWVYEIEAASSDIAYVKAERRWHDEMGLLVGSGSTPKKVVLTRV
jgi:hypothetical protein